MNKVLYKYKSIEQFHHYIDNVISWANYNNKKLPILKFNGTVKLHGSNSSIVYNKNKFITQSKNLIVTPEKDNMGFSKFAYNKKELFCDLMKKIADKITKNNEDIIIYGEWAGKGISKKVALSNIEPTFFIFSIAIKKEEEILHLSYEESKEILNNLMKEMPELNTNNIYSIFDFKNYEITIDFNNVQEAQILIDKLTQEVDNICPVCKQLGFLGNGEGIVWTCNSDINHFNNTMFKSKGQSHKVVNKKVPTKLDNDIEKNIKNFVDFCVLPARLEQGIDYLKEQNKEIKLILLSEYLKFIIIDCLKEEKKLLEKLNLKDYQKQVSAEIIKIAKPYFLNVLKENQEEKLKKIKI